MRFLVSTRLTTSPSVRTVAAQENDLMVTLAMPVFNMTNGTVGSNLTIHIYFIN